VIAFLTNLEENIGPESRFLHLCLTSSDILDTAFALQMKEALELVIKDLDALMEVVKERALQYKNTVMIGRSHGVHAEPITFGLKLLTWYSELKRDRERLKVALRDISYGKISGAVGTFANVPPWVEERALMRLGLLPDPVSTQIIQRDRHAFVFTCLAILAGTLERIAVEIRHLQRTEVLEAEEPFSKGQKGSSAMPHKKNPVGAENISGLSRLMRAHALAALENMALWHERDISHSSVERIIGPDAFILADYALFRMKNIVGGLVVHPDKMLENLNITKGLIFSQQVLNALSKKALPRQKAYELVQRNALKVWETGEDFKGLLLKDGEVLSYINREEIEELFDLNKHLCHVDYIFKRVFGLSTT
jgi:adenylosuccinate lyase